MPAKRTDFEDMTGRIFTRLTVTGPTFSPKGRRQWRCKCECGNEVQHNPTDLRAGKAKSCGCLKRELTALRATTHGHTAGRATTSEYRSWLGMKERCTNSGHKQWHDYGGRGVTVCEKWAKSFEAFLADMGPKPTTRHQIDRIDCDRGYEPSNCRWVTPIVNANNKRSNRRVEFGGRTQTLAEWGREIGVRGSTIHIRLATLGWSLERALTEPSNASSSPRRGRLVEWNGEAKTLTEWAKVTGLSRALLQDRISQKGWDPERAFTTPPRKFKNAA